MSQPNAHPAATPTEDMPWLFLDPNVYRRIGKVTIRHAGGTTRIKHVIVSNYGIFVLDENTDSGTFQASGGQNWTQYRDEQSINIENPIRQLANQVHALQEALNLPSSHFITAVFFTGGHVYLKGEVPENAISEGYTEYVKSFKKIILSDAQIEEILPRIKALSALPKPSHKSAHPRQVHPRPADPKPHKPAQPDPAPVPDRTKAILYGLVALVLGALITSLLFVWLT